MVKKISDKAIKFYKDGDFKKAIDEFSRILEREGDNAEIFNNIGLCYSNLGNDEKAEEYFLKAQALNPKLPQIYVNLADIYYKQKDFDSGIQLLSQGVYEMPENMVLRHYLARFYMEDARLDMAIDELEKILENQSENYDAYYDLARVHFELGNYESSISAFEKVLEFKSDNEWIYYYLAQAYEASDNLDKAISNYIKATSVNYNFPYPFKKLGILFMARGDYESAIEYFEDYLKKDLAEEEKKNIEKIVLRLKSKIGG